MASYPLIGKKTVYIDDLVISPDFVQDEVGTITLTPGTTEVASQSGTINVPRLAMPAGRRATTVNQRK